MGDDAISLDYLNPKKNGGNSTVVANAAQSKTNNKKDCFDCDYFPMCTYDVTTKYNGRDFHGIRKDDNSIEYFYCNNGEVIKRWDYTNVVKKQELIQGTWDDYRRTYEDYENKTASLVIMK